MNTDTMEAYASESSACQFWQDFGFADVTDDGEASLSGRLPEGVVVYAADTDADNHALTNIIKALPGPPVHLAANGSSQYVYRVAGVSSLPSASEVPAGVRLLLAGDAIRLPGGNDFEPGQYHYPNIGELPLLKAPCGTTPEAVTLPRPVVTTPLTAFSLRGQAAKFEESMVAAVPVLGDLCLAGQSTIWYAAPNAGKTLIALKLLMEAIRQERIAPGNAYYINADDGNEGFATKLRILDDFGAHTLAPGFSGFNACELSGLLRQMAETDTAIDTIVIVDTLKKVCDLMQKRDASAFSDAVRQYVMKGGTFLGLAHVNKNVGANGKPAYAGVADIVQDTDAAYMMTALDGVGDGEERVVQFESFKLRGPGTSKVAYAYAAGAGVSYHERLASVRVVDPKLFDEFERYAAEKSDAHLIAAITACIGDGIVQKMGLAKAASVRAHVSERAAIRALEAYTGDDPAKHHWSYRVRERGAKVFELLVTPLPTEEPASD